MNNRILLEDIKRIHELIGITPNILIESVITEGVVDKEAVALFKSIFGNIERAVVAGGKSYSKNQVKQVIGKIGLMQLSNEEKVLVQTLTRDAIALDKQLMKRFSNEIFGEMQKLTNRRARSAYYARVKKGLKEVLPKQEFDGLISNVNAKLNVQPKPTPNPNPAPNPAPNPNTGQGAGTPFVDITDEEFMKILVDEFKTLNVPIKLNKKQQQLFVSQIKPEINRLYSEIEPTLAQKYKELHLRYNQIPQSKRQEALIAAQKELIDRGIGLNIPEKYLHRIGKYLEKSLLENKENGYKKFTKNALLTISSYGITYIASQISTGKGEVNTIFGFSFKQSILFKTLLGILSVFTNGIPSAIMAYGSLLVSFVEGGKALFGKDVSELIGNNPISVDEAITYVKSNANPLGMDFNQDIPIYEPTDKNGKKIEGNRGAFINVYIEKELQATLKKDITNKIIDVKPN